MHEFVKGLESFFVGLRGNFIVFLTYKRYLSFIETSETLIKASKILKVLLVIADTTLNQS